MKNEQRNDNRLRPITITPNFTKHPEGSVLIEVGDTKVICNASVEERVPPFMRGQGKGWITAEYSMLHRATAQRNIRESTKGKVSGRTMEIQRLVGRALRTVVELDTIGERTDWIDCDVIQADGGTRTASITGAFIAMAIAFTKLVANVNIKKMPVTNFLAATSVGVIADGDVVLDVNYEEDSKANVDMNIVMTGDGEFVEIQGTGEEETFSRQQLQSLLDLAEEGIQELITEQKNILGKIANLIGSSEKEMNKKDAE